MKLFKREEPFNEVKERQPFTVVKNELDNTAEVNLYGEVVNNRPKDFWTDEVDDSMYIVLREFLDELRKEAWRDAYADFKDKAKELKRKKGKPKKSDCASKKLNEAKIKATEIKTSTYTLGKAPENLTKNQAAKLEMIANTNPKLFRGYKLKEQLRLALKLSDIKDAKAELKSFFWRATHSRIQVFKELL